jgi:hypothetical protein
MFKKFIEILKKEIRALEVLLFFTEKQHNSLRDYNISEIEKNTFDIEDAVKKLAKIEEERIEFFINWFKISKKEAQMLKLSTLEKNLKGDALILIQKLKTQLNELNTKINHYNRQNKILTNRAKYSVNNIMKMLSNSHKTVFNVKV